MERKIADQEKAIATIHELRAKLSDREIGRRLDISAQYVRLLAGKRRDDPNVPQPKKRQKQRSPFGLAYKGGRYKGFAFRCPEETREQLHELARRSMQNGSKMTMSDVVIHLIGCEYAIPTLIPVHPAQAHAGNR
jgi:cation transport regulator ChaC